MSLEKELILKELPDFREITFRSFNSRNCGSGSPGIFIVKRKNLIIKVGGSINRAYEVAKRYIARCKENDPHNEEEVKYEVASISMKPELVSLALANYQKQWENIALDDEYESFIRYRVNQGMRIKPNQLRKYPLFVRDKKGNYVEKYYTGTVGLAKIRMFKRNLYLNRSGVYVIYLNGKVVYVGKSNRNLYDRLYAHFVYKREVRQYEIEHFGAKRVVTYVEHLKHLSNNFEAAVIEIPHRFRTYSRIESLCRELEDYLIKQLKPTDNRRGADYHDNETTSLQDYLSKNIFPFEYRLHDTSIEQLKVLKEDSEGIRDTSLQYVNGMEARLDLFIQNVNAELNKKLDKQEENVGLPLKDDLPF